MRPSLPLSPPVRDSFAPRWSLLSVIAAAAHAQLPARSLSSIRPLIKQTTAEKPKFAERQQRLLQHRYDLSDRPSKETTMSLGKPIQEGVRVKLPEGITWDKLAGMTPDEIKEKTTLARRLLSFAPSPSRKRRHGLHQGADRRTQKTDRPRPYPF